MTIRLGQALTAWVWLVLACAAWPGAAGAAQAPDQHPSWWGHMTEEARERGYGLVDEAQLQALMDSGQDFALLDARPGYEFQRGHLPGALNLEFHLGDRLEISPAKAQALRDLLGPDLDRLVVVYCRSFR